MTSGHSKYCILNQVVLKVLLSVKKNPYCRDKLENQYYEHLKLKKKMVERFSIHIYHKIVRLTNTPQSY